MSSEPPVERALVLFDGECALCRSAVSWARRNERGNRLQFVPYQIAPTPPVTSEVRAACARSVHIVLPNGSVLRAGRAALYILERAGRPHLARFLRMPPMIWVVELGYRIVALNRPFFARFLFSHERDDGWTDGTHN